MKDREDKDMEKTKGVLNQETIAHTTKKGEEILQVLRKSAEFTHEILKENERLRFKVAQLEQDNAMLSKNAASESVMVEISALREQMETIKEERDRLIKRFKEIERENLNFANRYVEIEQENNVLANLYIATYQLHSTLDVNEVVRVIMEIIINLVGAEQFGLMLLDEKANELRAVAAEGLQRDSFPSVKLGEGIIGGVAKTGEEYYRKDISKYVPLDPLSPMVCIPMKIKERVIGVVVIYKLLQQKDEFTNLDYELFSMLAGHSATAIFSAKLYTESERKLSTIQGFIDLLTKQEVR